MQHSLIVVLLSAVLEKLHQVAPFFAAAILKCDPFHLGLSSFLFSPVGDCYQRFFHDPSPFLMNGWVLKIQKPLLDERRGWIYEAENRRHQSKPFPREERL
jgi:hypothetical protein